VVITTAHELGHVLGLPHMPSYTNLMFGGTVLDSVNLEVPQIRIAEHRARYFVTPIFASDDIPHLPVGHIGEWPFM